MKRINTVPDSSAAEASIYNSQHSYFLSKSDLSSIQDLLHNTPSELTDEQVRKTSLHALVDSLGQQHSSRTIIDTYLRWLEIQRQSPAGNYTTAWRIVLTSWTQSLKVRGFSLPEVTREVDKWKAANSPLKIFYSVEGETRLPPSALQLAWSWKEVLQENINYFPLNKLDSKSYTWLAEKMYDKPPTMAPSYWVCHRCNGKGHYVGDCPTNEDPTYDLAPGEDYQCKHCKQSGDHYYLFCPKNPDPDSVYNKRQGKIQSLIPGNGSLRKCFNRSPKSSWRISQLSSSPYSRLSPSPNERGVLLSKCELSTPCATTTCSEVQMEDPFIERFGKTEMRTASKDFVMANNKFSSLSDENLNPSDFLMRENPKPVRKRCTIKGELSLLPRPGNELNDYKPLSHNHIDASQVCRGNHITAPQDTDESEKMRALQSSRTDLEGEGITREWKQNQITLEPIITVTPSSSLAESNTKEFLARLFSNHPSEVGKARKIRPTAMDMWEISNDQKLLEEGNRSDQEMADYIFTEDRSQVGLKLFQKNEEVERLPGRFKQDSLGGETGRTGIFENRVPATTVEFWQVSDGSRVKEGACGFEKMTSITTPNISQKELDDAIEDLFSEPQKEGDDCGSQKLGNQPKSEERAQLIRSTVIQRGRIWVQHLEMKLLDDQQSRLEEISCHELGTSLLIKDDQSKQEVQKTIQRTKRGIEKAAKQLRNVVILKEMLESGEEVDGALMERMTSKSIAKQYVQYITES